MRLKRNCERDGMDAELEAEILPIVPDKIVNQWFLANRGFRLLLVSLIWMQGSEWSEQDWTGQAGLVESQV